MKRFLSVALALSLMVCALSGCYRNPKETVDTLLARGVGPVECESVTLNLRYLTSSKDYVNRMDCLVEWSGDLYHFVGTGVDYLEGLSERVESYTDIDSGILYMLSSDDDEWYLHEYNGGFDPLLEFDISVSDASLMSDLDRYYVVGKAPAMELYKWVLADFVGSHKLSKWNDLGDTDVNICLTYDKEICLLRSIRFWFESGGVTYSLDIGVDRVNGTCLDLPFTTA